MDISTKGRGALRRAVDPRDVPFSAFLTGTPSFDYQQGFGYYQQLFGKIKVEDQGRSLSCVGQACSKLIEILDFHATGRFFDVSARDVYSGIYVNGGGAYGYKGLSRLVIRGVAEESIVPSYINGQPPTEQFMETPDTSDIAFKSASIRKLNGYTNIAEGNIDQMAAAIEKNKAVVFGVTLSNQGWQTEHPRPPLAGESTDGHFLVGVDIAHHNGEDCIVFLNSWSDQWGDKGFGYLGLSYFASNNVFNGMTPTGLTDEWQKIIAMKDVIKLENSQDQYLVESGIKYLIPDAETLDFLANALKIILTTPRIVNQQEFDSYKTGLAIPSMAVMVKVGSIYSTLKDAFENQ